MLGDDAELTAAVLAAQDGDEGAFRTVYRAVHPRLLGYVRTLVGEPDAEDVASEAWLQIARDLDRFSGDADRFRGWAARIARNRAFDHIRMRGRRPAVGGDETELNGRPAESDTADEAMEALATGSTMALIARLPQDQAEAVVLRVVVGLDAKSAAKTLGKRPGAVRTAAHRGLKRLAELLGADDSEGSSPPLPAHRRPDGRSRPEGDDPADGSDGSGGPGYGYPPPGAYGADGAGPVDANDTGTPQGPCRADGADTGAGPAGHGADLDGVPPQRGPGPGATAPAGVTHSRPRTQKDM
ncbi:RNA polymerase sigma factor [Streptomyces sp. NPDC004609]|uniref:RNA polymerase sigma factor n=1 Tax=Streptomyces sp. NPDC004609 TaxID=3364704 RepID=UPI0036CA6108